MPTANSRPASRVRRGSWLASATLAALLATACSDAGITSPPPAADPSVAPAPAVVQPLGNILTGALTNGGNDFGSITSAGQVDTWTFTVSNTNLPVAISMGELTGDANFTPHLRLQDPNGVIIANRTAATVVQINAILALAGTYTVLAASNDPGHVGTGTYSLILQKSGAFVTPAGDDGGHLNTNGSLTNGTISIGDLDRFTFSAIAGQTITVTMNEVTGTDFNPWIRLVGTSGTILQGNTGTTTAVVSIAAPTTGLYTIALGTNDVGNDGTGTYTVNVTGALVYPFAGTWGPITATGPTGRQVTLTLAINMGNAPGRPDINGNAKDELVGTQYTLLYDGSLLEYDSNVGLNANLDLVFANSPSAGITNVAQTSSSALSANGNVQLVTITFNIPIGASGTVNATASFVEALAGLVSLPTDVTGDVTTAIPALVIP